MSYLLFFIYRIAPPDCPSGYNDTVRFFKLSYLISGKANDADALGALMRNAPDSVGAICVTFISRETCCGVMFFPKNISVAGTAL